MGNGSKNFQITFFLNFLSWEICLNIESTQLFSDLFSKSDANAKSLAKEKVI